MSSLFLSTGAAGRYRPLALCIAASLAWPLHAQPAAVVLPSVVVTGARDDTSYTVQETSIGTKLPSSLRETPQSVSVMTRQRLEDQNLTSLDEVMRQTPGMSVDLSGTGVIPAYFSRGYAVEYFQYDGTPIQTGGASWSQPDMVMFERVETLRGAAGLFTGAGQPGGVINLVRKRPGKTLRFQGSVGLGSWDNRRAEADISTPFNATGTVRGRFAAAYDDRDSHVDWAHSRRWSFYGIVEADLGPSTTLAVGASHQRRHWRPAFGGLPHYEDGGDIGLPRSTFLSTPWTYWDFESRQMFAELSHAFNARWRLQASVVSDHEESDLKYGYTRGAVNRRTLAGPRLLGGANHYDNTQLGIDAHVTGRFEALGRQHDIVIGANWYDRKAESWNGALHGLVSRPIDVFNPNSTEAADPGSPSWSSQNMTRTGQHGIYGTVRLRVAEPLSLILGGRMSWWRSQTENLRAGTTGNRYQENGHFTPYAALVYDVSPQWSVYASYADIFRVQRNLLDVNGNGLPPINGVNLEAGVKGSFHDGRLNTSLAVFRVVESNRPLAVTDPVVGGCCYATNGKVRSQGFEVEVSGELARGWQLGAGYTYNVSKYLRDAASGGQPFSSATPRHLLKLWTSYQLPGDWHAWTVGAGIRAQSGFYTQGGTPAVRVSQGGYAVADLRVSYQVNEHWSAALNVNNVFDRSYYTRLGSPGFGPATMGNVYGEPRSVMLTLRARY